MTDHQKALPIVERLRRTAKEIGPFSVVNCYFREAADTIEELVAERDALAKRVHDLEGDFLAYRKTVDVMVEDEADRVPAQTKIDIAHD